MPATAPAGLDAAEAARRLAAHGPNELAAREAGGWWTLLAGVLREPMFMLLIGASAVYFLLGDLEEAIVLGASIGVVVLITLYQERKSERALGALRELSSPRALVVRGGVQVRIAGREVVPGDIVLLREGDRVPADARVLEASDLSVDESLLTGESVPVRKRAARTGEAGPFAPGGDDLPFVFSGALVSAGYATVEVAATGARTQLGQIGGALQGVTVSPTPLQQETARFVRQFALLGAALCAIVVLLSAFTRGGWLEGLLSGLTLAMAMLPEEFPVVLTVFLALGAWRISRSGVLTRHMPAIETLGAASVLCVDKTGTLTLNRMQLARLVTADGAVVQVDGPSDALPSSVHEVLEFAALASEPDPFDPMDRAIRDVADGVLEGTGQLHRDWSLAHEYSLSSDLLAHTHGWRTREADRFVVAAKGAPEAIAEICRLPSAAREAMLAQVGRLGAEGLRVLGVAGARQDGTAWPESQRGFDFRYLGLVAMVDPLRPTVGRAIEECTAAGIRVVMITGDYPVTASAIARAAGLPNAGAVVSGLQLAAMSDAELAARLPSATVFARMVPTQKLRLVQALSASGEVVAMTGDGVNDAPALKAAQIGIAMGRRGTEVAREAADLVLLEDDFDSIVKTVRLGRRIYDNIENATGYLVAVHIPTAGMAVLPLLAGWPMMFFPVHIVFIEFVIDPACSIAFEAEQEDDGVMRRPPRPRTRRLFDRQALAIAALQGLAVLVATAGVYGVLLAMDRTADAARAAAFACIVFGNLGLILCNRSRTESILRTWRRPNRAMGWVFAGTLAGLALVLTVPLLQRLFQFAPIGLAEAAAALGAALAAVAVSEVAKAALRGKPAPQA
ncbi:MAG: cation-translocating P-type ATPase [bacterium]